MRGMLRGVAVVLFVVSGAARAERDDGRLVAVADGALMTAVYRIRASGIEKVGRQKVAGIGEFGWTDSATLWVLDKDVDKITVHKLVAGAPAQTIDVPMSAWEVAPTPDSLLVDLRITGGGQVWLESCQKRRASAIVRA